MPRFVLIALSLFIVVGCLEDFTIRDPPPECGPVALDDCDAFKVYGFDDEYFGDDACSERVVPVDRDVPPGWIVCALADAETVVEAWEAGVMWTGEPLFARGADGACIEAEWQYWGSHPSFGTPVTSCDL